MDDETNRLRNEFLGAFDKPPKPAEPDDEPALSFNIAEVREHAKRLLALCDEMDRIINETDVQARTAADNMIGLMKRIK